MSVTLNPKILQSENTMPTKSLLEQTVKLSALKEKLGQKIIRLGSRRIAVTWAITAKRCDRKCVFALVGIDPCVYRLAP